MRILGIALVCAGLLALCALHVEVGPTPAYAALDTGGDSTLAAGGSFKIYPLFTNGGGHIHNPQFVTNDNGYQQGLKGFVATDLSNLRLVIFGPAGIDTTGRTCKAGESYPLIAPFDSVSVLNTGGTSTLVRWRASR